MVVGIKIFKKKIDSNPTSIAYNKEGYTMINSAGATTTS